MSESDPMRATKAIGEFLRHLRTGDLPDAELFALKATAFDLMAEQYDEDGSAFASEAAECRRCAAEARSVSQASAVPECEPGTGWFYCNHTGEVCRCPCTCTDQRHCQSHSGTAGNNDPPTAPSVPIGPN